MYRDGESALRHDSPSPRLASARNGFVTHGVVKASWPRKENTCSPSHAHAGGLSDGDFMVLRTQLGEELGLPGMEVEAGVEARI